MKRLCVVVGLVCFLCKGVFAQIDYRGMGNWALSNGWSNGAPPTGAIEVKIRGSATILTLNTSTGDWGAAQRLRVYEGATLIIEEGAELLGAGWMRVGAGSAGYVQQTGGLVKINNDRLGIGDSAGSDGYYTISGGTITYSGARGELVVGARGGKGILTIVGTDPVIQMSSLIVGQDAGALGMLEFQLGAEGVSPIKLAGSASIDPLGDDTFADLIISSIGEAPLADVVLVDLPDSANVAGVFDAVNGEPAPEGVSVVVKDGGDTYYYTLTYKGGSAGNDIVLLYKSVVMGRPELAWSPYPRNRAVAELGNLLSWKPGQYAASHDVYFGTDFNDVNDANNVVGLWPEFKGNQNILTYNPGKLDLETTYYWRIDEVNNTAAAPVGSPWKGTVWRFTTSNYLVVDNMESYGSADTPGTPPPAGSRIWFTWKDGEGWVTPSIVAGNGSGAVIDISTITHGESQSLQFMYDNDGKNFFGSTTRNYSEITIDTSYLPVGQDWTQGGVTTLSLWFYGNLNNIASSATDQIYVKVNNVRKDYDGDVNAIMQAQWHEWNIDLTKLGLDLTKVTSLAIGIGNSANTTPGGSGVVYFDDIRLCRPR